MSRASRAKGPVQSTLDIGCHTGKGRDGMNDPEVTMSNAVTNTRLVAHTKALAAAGAVPELGAEQALATFDEVRAMTWRLLNPV